MSDAVNSVQQYRQRARQLRVISLDWIDHPDFGVLVKIASDYERLADQAGQVDNLNPSRDALTPPLEAMRLRLRSGSN